MWKGICAHPGGRTHSPLPAVLPWPPAVPAPPICAPDTARGTLKRAPTPPDAPTRPTAPRAWDRPADHQRLRVGPPASQPGCPCAGHRSWHTQASPDPPGCPDATDRAPRLGQTCRSPTLEGGTSGVPAGMPLCRTPLVAHSSEMRAPPDAATRPTARRAWDRPADHQRLRVGPRCADAAPRRCCPCEPPSSEWSTIPGGTRALRWPDLLLGRMQRA
jgi:hypothetical protein